MKNKFYTSKRHSKRIEWKTNKRKMDKRYREI